MNELILGLLMIDEQTSYSVKKTIQNGLGLLSSDSIGSIQLSLKRLEEKKLIKHNLIMENNKIKKVYRILPSGIDYFNFWINKPFDLSGKKNTELKKLFFMSYSDKQSRIIRINQYIELLISEKRKLEVLKEYGENMSTKLSSEKKSIASFQLKTIDYGIAFFNFEIQWYTDLVERGMENESL